MTTDGSSGPSAARHRSTSPASLPRKESSPTTVSKPENLAACAGVSQSTSRAPEFVAIHPHSSAELVG
jgi:hypothetical protein